MTDPVLYPCIGGPLDGQSWAGDVPPSVLLQANEETRCPVTPVLIDNVAITVDVVRYEARTMRQPFGGYVTLYVPSTMTDVELKALLNSRYPSGLV